MPLKPTPNVSIIPFPIIFLYIRNSHDLIALLREKGTNTMYDCNHHKRIILNSLILMIIRIQVVSYQMNGSITHMPHDSFPAISIMC